MSTAQVEPVVEDNNKASAVNNSTSSSTGNEVKAYDYGGNPLLHAHTGESARLPAFGGEFQPGLYTAHRKFANPAPLGLCAFALTTFVLSLINIKVRGVAAPNFIVCLAFGYGGFVQLLAGMWCVLNSYLCGLLFFATLGSPRSRSPRSRSRICS
jgi:hypothetical protein